MISRLPKRILVLRGGKNFHGPSITTGASLLASFTRHGAEVIDIYVDGEGVWHQNGVPTNHYKILPYVDAYVDLTEEKGEVTHHALAEKLGVISLAHPKRESLDRETLFRLLRQHNIPIAQAEFIRKEIPISESYVHELWRTLLGPLYIRNVAGRAEGVVVFSLDSFLSEIAKRHDEHDIHVMRYRKEKPRSLVVLSSYRGADMYIPMSVETSVTPKELPRRDNRIMPLTYLSKEEKQELDVLGKKIYAIIGGEGHIVIDYLATKNGPCIVDVSTRPSLLAGGRFSEAVATTGIDMGHYFLSTLE